ncbi:UNKNOWN [Stylonychia lemnae]|uniref:Uncharacterized protein n=1 Tax=Stylonychia lemnae TaxID=5949 RepID=A0A078AL97_STYLE|nr:UNKNOWN [Stylonychia lemnae]|eukprot:CDW81638.1 UNKNOWN [Stylonychia lemnae]
MKATSILNKQNTSTVIKTFYSRAFSEIQSKPRRKLVPLDSKKDFKFFIMKSKVQQVYREALKDAQTIQDPDVRQDMYQMMRDEFDVFRRLRDQPLDPHKIDYNLALIRKKMTILEEIKKRVI